MAYSCIQSTGYTQRCEQIVWSRESERKRTSREKGGVSKRCGPQAGDDRSHGLVDVSERRPASCSNASRDLHCFKVNKCWEQMFVYMVREGNLRKIANSERSTRRESGGKGSSAELSVSDHHCEHSAQSLSTTNCLEEMGTGSFTAEETAK